MKKLLAFLTVLCFIPCVCCAEIDLSGMTFEELVDLRQQALNVLYGKDGWHDIVIAGGIFYVGYDIPAGIWDVECAEAEEDTLSKSFASISYGTVTESNGNYASWSSGNSKIYVFNPNSKYYTGTEETKYRITLKEGMILYVSDSFGSAIFTPYVGNNILLK